MAYPYKLYIWLGNLEEDDGILLGVLERPGNTANKITVYNEIDDYGNNVIKPCLNYEFVKARFRINQTIYKSPTHTIKNEWSLQATGTTEIDIVFYDKKHKVTLDLNYNGAGIQETLIVSCGVKLPDIDVPERQGYTFDSYRLSPSGSTIKYYDKNGRSNYIWGSSSTDQHTYNEFTLYAYWNPVTTYTLTLDCGDDVDYEGDTSVKVTIGKLVPNITPPIKTGFKFLGYWVENTTIQYYDEDGVGLIVWNAYNNGTLTARWQELEKTTIIYNANGGSFSNGSTRISKTIYGETSPISTYIIKEIPERIFSYKGATYKLTFNYWALLNSDGTIYRTYSYSPNTQEQFTSVYPTHTLTAIWSPIFRLVDHSDENIIYDEIKVTYGKSIPSRVDIPVKEGYKFLGYYASPTSTNTPFYDENGNAAFDDNWLGDGDGDGSHYNLYLLFAHWKAAEYKTTIVFKNLRDDVEPDNMPDTITKYGETSSITITIPEAPIRPNCEFVCWGVLDDEGNFINQNRFEAGKSYQFQAAKGNGVTNTLTAIWKYKLWLHPNFDMSYSGTVDEVSIYSYAEYGCVPDTVPYTLPTLSGSVLDGYYTNTGTKYIDSKGNGVTEWWNDFVGILYARWVNRFDWTTEKRTGMEWNLTHEEWNALQDFINNKRDTPYAFTRAAKGMDFTADIYNEILISLGVPEELYVKKGQSITEKLMYDIVDRANAM